MRLSVTNSNFSHINLGDLHFNGEGWSSLMKCPFHAGDNDPSFGINIRTNFFNCFGCGINGGVFALIGIAKHGAAYNPDLHNKEAREFYFGNAGHVAMDLPKIVTHKKRIKRSSNELKSMAGKAHAAVFFHRNTLLHEFGINMKAADNFVLGYTRVDGHPYWTIPHIMSNNSYVGINRRYYKRQVPDNVKRYHQVPGSSASILYNGKVLVHRESDTIFVVEDEWSVMHLWQFGLMAVSKPAACEHEFGGLHKDWLPYFEPHRVYVIPDIDENETGIKTAIKRQEATNGFIIHLPKLDGVNDFADLSRLYPDTANEWLCSIVGVSNTD